VQGGYRGYGEPLRRALSAPPAVCQQARKAGGEEHQGSQVRLRGHRGLLWAARSLASGVSEDSAETEGVQAAGGVQ
jgi:hypothetical protein